MEFCRFKWLFLLILLTATVLVYIKLAMEEKWNFENARHSTNSVQWVSHNFSTEQDPLDEALKNATNKIIIIIWDAPFGRKVQFGKKIEFDSMPYECGNCQVTLNRTKINEKNAKAVVFHFNELKPTRMPATRRLDQYYVWRCMESPIAVREPRRMKLTEYDNVFNMTMNYRRDADIYVPYGNVFSTWKTRGGKKLSTNELDAFVKQKTHLSIWVASNCGYTRGAKDRMEYVKSLINDGLDDIVLGGRCFKNRQPKFENSKYKFYFSLENSWNCRDYITEKFFYNGLISGTVPVVIGPSRDDYEAVAPPNSFIYAKDFSSPKKLVEYLKYLDKNDTAYKEYLKWTTEDLVDIPEHHRETDYCQLCRVLHGINVDNIFSPVYQSQLSGIPLFGLPSKPRIVPSLAKWFYGTENSGCLKNPFP